MSREAVVEAILGASRITAICHENPDADTLGSALALRIAAERLGKQAEVVAADPVPPLAAPPARAPTRSARRPGSSRTWRSCSTARHRAPVPWPATAPTWLARARIVNIDHHVSNDGSEAGVAWVDADAAATCEMVALLIPELGVRDRRRISPPS